MNGEKQVMKLAAERLLAVANGATLEWASGTHILDVLACGVHTIGGGLVRIRPPAVAPEPRPSLPCPPRPTPEQVAAARMPDGRRVKDPTVCEVPNGRAWFTPDTMEIARHPYGPDYTQYDSRRWIAEPADAIVEPWTLGPEHAGKVATRKAGGGWGIITGVRDGQFTVAGWGKITPAELLRDWTHNGQPCGVAK